MNTVFLARPASAELDLRGGIYVEYVEGFFVGAGGLWQIGNKPWFINPNVE